MTAMGIIQVAGYKSPMGEIILGSYEGRLCLADWRFRKMRESIDRRIQKGLEATYEEGVSDTISQAMDELGAYFKGDLRQFNMPLTFVGTDF